MTIDRPPEEGKELQAGVYRSAFDADDWQSDPDAGGGEMHVLVEQPDSYAGMTRFAEHPEPIEWTLPVRETVVVLEGAARIEIEGSDTVILGAGDMASLPAGAKTTWHITAPYKEIWFFPRPYGEDE
jgi:uncharacterized cupin superfamily protein